MIKAWTSKELKEREEVFEDVPHDDGEEFEEDQRQYPYATVARIGVTKNPSVFEKNRTHAGCDSSSASNEGGWRGSTRRLGLANWVAKKLN